MNRLHKLLNVMRSQVEFDTDYCGKDPAGTLLKCLVKYEKNYTGRLTDFSFSTTNNLSERSLISVQSKLKTAKQFSNTISKDLCDNA